MSRGTFRTGAHAIADAGRCPRCDCPAKLHNADGCVRADHDCVLPNGVAEPPGPPAGVAAVVAGAQVAAAAREQLAELVRELREGRESAGLSQHQIAALAGITQTHVSQVERGTRQLSVEVAARLADPLGLTVEIRLIPKGAPR